MAACDEKTRMTALHEAAHAVMALRNGVELVEVSIVPKGNLSGYCSYHAIDITRSEINKLCKQGVAEDLSVLKKILKWLEITEAGNVIEENENTLPLLSIGSGYDSFKN